MLVRVVKNSKAGLACVSVDPEQWMSRSLDWFVPVDLEQWMSRGLNWCLKSSNA